MINHRIINHIQTSNIDFDTWNDIYSTYIANIASKCEEVVFQTNFGFAGYDCPVTIYISNKWDEHHIGIDTTIKCYCMDWSLFPIDNAEFNGIADEWKFNPNLDRDIPNVENMNPVELFLGQTSTDDYDMNESFDICKCNGYQRLIAEAIYARMTNYFSHDDDEKEWDDFARYSFMAVIYGKELKPYENY